MPASRALILRKRVELNVHPSSAGLRAPRHRRRHPAGAALHVAELCRAHRGLGAHASLGAALWGACGTAI
jgi:hypothetical protein